MEFNLKLAGTLLIIMAVIHVIFPKYFNWKGELKSLSLINRQMMYVHTFFIAVIIFLMGLLCLTCTQEIIETSLGRKIALGLGIFWLFRLFFQFFVYSSVLWKGKKFETTIHVLFAILWTYFSAVFLCVYLIMGSGFDK